MPRRIDEARWHLGRRHEAGAAFPAPALATVLPLLQTA